MDSNPSDERGILNTSGLGTGTARGPLTADDIIAAFEAIERSFDDNPCHPRNGGITGGIRPLGSCGCMHTGECDHREDCAFRLLG